MPEESRSMNQSSGLRATVIRGGAYTISRQFLSLVITVVGVVILTSRLGPTNYGIYAVGLGFASYGILLGKWGMDFYLTSRHRDTVDRNLERQAVGLLVITSVLSTVLFVVIATVYWKISGYSVPLVPLLIMVLSVPLNCVSQVSVSRLERSFQYRRVAVIDLSMQLSFYVTGIVLSAWYVDPFVLSVAYAMQNLIYLIVALALGGRIPLPVFSLDNLGGAWRSGGLYSASTSVWQARTMASTVVLGLVADAAVVGVVALAVRVVESATFVKSTFWRLSIPAFSRVVTNDARFRSAVQKFTLTQLVASGAPLVLTVALGPLLFPLLGQEWSGVSVLLPFLAVGSIVNSLFSMIYSAMYVSQDAVRVLIFNALHVGVLFAATILLGPLWPDGVGYGWAEIIACSTYLLIVALTWRRFLSKIFLAPMLVMFAFVAGILAFSSTPYWALLAVIPVASREVRSISSSIISRASRLKKAV